MQGHYGKAKESCEANPDLRDGKRHSTSRWQEQEWKKIRINYREEPDNEGF